jgi:hypothetical protein
MFNRGTVSDGSTGKAGGRFIRENREGLIGEAVMIRQGKQG